MRFCQYYNLLEHRHRHQPVFCSLTHFTILMTHLFLLQVFRFYYVWISKPVIRFLTFKDLKKKRKYFPWSLKQRCFLKGSRLRPFVLLVTAPTNLNFIYILFDLLRAGRSGDRSPVGAKFFAPVQTGPGVHPACCTMRTGSFPGVEAAEAWGWPPPHLVPRS